MLRASGTRQRPRNRITGARLPGRPEAIGSAGAEWTGGKWTVAADLYWQSAVDDLGQTGPDQELRNHAGRRAVVNLSARWKATEAVSVFARVENLLGEEYVETPSAPRGLPLSVAAGVALDF